MGDGQERKRFIVPGMVQRESGLWMPADVGQRVPEPHPHLALPPPSTPTGVVFAAGSPPTDLDSVFVAPDPEALGVHAPSLEATVALVETVPLERAIFAMSALTAGAWFAGRDQAAHMRLAEAVFAGRPVLDLLRAFVREDPHHLIFNEQHLTVLTRLLIVHGADGAAGADLTPDEIDTLLMALLAVAGLVARYSDPEAPDGPMGWVPWLVRSGLYFDRANLGNDQGRARALFGDLAAEADPKGVNYCDVAAWSREDLAAPSEQTGFGYAMAAFAKALDEDAETTERFIAVVRDGLLAGNLAVEVVGRLVDGMSATRQEFVERFTADGESVDHLLWDRAPFEQRPFLRLDDGRLVLLSPRFLHSWMGEGQYYRLLDSASHRPDPARPKESASLRFTRFHGELVERYLQHVTERSHTHQLQAGLVRITPDRPYIGRDGTENRTPDLVLDFTTDLVAVEVTGGRPARRARVISDPSLMLKELDEKVIGKLEELDAAMRDVLDEVARLPDLGVEVIERAWPVVVVPSTIIQSDVLWAHIHSRAPELSTGHPALQPPTLLSFEDYETAMAAVEAGHGLPTLLAQRSASVYARMPPSHYFAARLPGLGRPSYVNEQLRAGGDDAADLMFPGRRRA